MAETKNATARKWAEITGQQIRSEDGTGKSVEWIEKYSDNFHIQGDGLLTDNVI